MVPGPPVPATDPPTGASGRIVLDASFFPLAFFLAFCRLTVTTGATSTRAGWGRTAITVPPGRHPVQVHVDYVGAFGPAEDTVPVRPGESVTVHYRAPAFMFLKGAIGPTRPATPGAWISLVIVAALVALLLVPVLVAAVALSAPTSDSSGPVSGPSVVSAEAPTAAGPLPAPVPLFPPDGTVLSVYPRSTTLTWDPVPGAAGYNVEIQYQDVRNGEWHSEAGQWNPSVSAITSTTHTFNFIGAQPGRWRIIAVDRAGAESAPSDWLIFEYTR